MSSARRLRASLVTALAVVLPISGLAGLSAAQAAPAGDRPAPAAVGEPDLLLAAADEPSGTAQRYLVRFADGARAEAAALEQDGVEVDGVFTAALQGAVITATPAQARALAQEPGVLAVTPDVRVRSAMPWGIDRLDQPRLPLSQSYTPPGTGAGVSIYVIDGGLRTDHTDFAGRVRPGASVFPDGVGDCRGHGTHVAGTAAGTVHGVAKRALVVPVRVLDCEGTGYLSDVVAGVDWVARQHAPGAPAVANLSLVVRGNAVFDQAVQGLINDGVSVVAAAGNSNEDACAVSPARLPAVLTVAATASNDAKASFSNHGRCVDLHAPGEGILSAYHTSATATATQSGTSMAAPHVAGAAAVLLGAYPRLTPAQVASRLVATATPGVVTGAPAGTPNRLLSFGPAFMAAFPAPPVARKPGAVKRVKARGLRKAAVVRWKRGATGSARVTRYTVVVYRKGRKVRVQKVSGSKTKVVIKRLKPGKRYTFRVKATSKAGSSPLSRPSKRVTVRR